MCFIVTFCRLLAAQKVSFQMILKNKVRNEPSSGSILLSLNRDRLQKYWAMVNYAVNFRLWIKFIFRFFPDFSNLSVFVIAYFLHISHRVSERIWIFFNSYFFQFCYSQPIFINIWNILSQSGTYTASPKKEASSFDSTVLTGFSKPFLHSNIVIFKKNPHKIL